MTEMQPITEDIVINDLVKKPTQFNQDVANELLDRICEGETTKSICSDLHMPSTQTMSLWVRGKNLANTSFPGEYARARLVAANTLADEILDIADSTDDESMERALKAVEQLGSNATPSETRRAFFYAKKRSIESTQIQIDARKFLVARMHPSAWGEKVTHEITAAVEVNQRIDFSGMSTDQMERLASIEKELRVVGEGTTVKSKNRWPLLAGGDEELSKKNENAKNIERPPGGRPIDTIG